jgi:hypothetical protein
MFALTLLFVPVVNKNGQVRNKQRKKTEIIMRYLFVTPWNDGSVLSRIARCHVLRDMEQGHDIVILGKKKEDTWVEDNDVHETLKYHEIGEPVRVAEGDLIEAPKGIDKADQAVFQTIFYAKAYDVDAVYVYGDMVSLMAVVARIKLVEDFRVSVRCCLFDVIFDVEEGEACVAVRMIMSRAEEIVTYSSHVISRLSGMISSSSSLYTPTTLFSDVPVQSVTEARKQLVIDMGMDIPSKSKVFLCVCDHEETCLRVLEAFQRARQTCERFNESDSVLLWFQHSKMNQKFARAIVNTDGRTSNHVIYTVHPLPTKVLAHLYDAANYGVHFNKVCREEHAVRRRYQIGNDVDTDVVCETIGRLTCDVLVPNVESLRSAMLRAFIDV